MAITTQIFEASLKCPSKCWFRSLGEEGTGNMYADWVRMQNETYRTAGIERLLNDVTNAERAVAQAELVNVKTAKWKFAANFPARKENLESNINIVERVPSEGRGKPAQFTPIRFIFTNKLSKDDKLLLAYDAFVLSEMLRRDVIHGKIIHGDSCTTVKVRTSALAGTVRKLTAKIAALLESDAPPDLILNRHCTECEYQGRCRQKAIEKDDLSLLAGMSEKERKKLNSKGIFTLTQFSYTFRPRKKSKRSNKEPVRYHHSLKSLAIRENRIYVAGTPKLKISGTPVYLDVEGIPDQDFYYLIGVRLPGISSMLQLSFWANDSTEEEKIWQEFLRLIATTENPQLFYYGSYETTFLKNIKNRYGNGIQYGVSVESLIENSQNILSVIYGHIYFPAYTNGLKEIASYLDFKWSTESPSGLKSLLLRQNWEANGNANLKQELLAYNADDCEALEAIVKTVLQLIPEEGAPTEALGLSNAAHIDSLKPSWPLIWGKKEFVFPELDYVNSCAYWDYQRDRIYIRSNPRLKQTASVMHHKKSKRLPPNVIVRPVRPSKCPNCELSKFVMNGRHSRLFYDLRFSVGCIKRWVSKYIIDHYKCKNCGTTFISTIPCDLERHHLYGLQLQAYVIHNIIELHIPTFQLSKIIQKAFGLPLVHSTIRDMKRRAVEIYRETFESIKSTLLHGKLIHADETHVSVKGKDTYVWVFTSMEEVVYVWSETREADLPLNFLKDFKGVLVSDFYAAYDSIDCPQQRCLIHLIRDLNDDVFKEPFNLEIKGLVQEFATLLRSIIETVDRFGLKTYFLKKHKANVKVFFNALLVRKYKTELAQKAQTRFRKNQNRLFSFLDYDNVPWNNNNAEHAIRAFGRIRDAIEGRTSASSITDYLILLSICQTCEYRGIDFHEFLRSGEKDIDVFAMSRLKRGSFNRPYQSNGALRQKTA